MESAAISGSATPRAPENKARGPKGGNPTPPNFKAKPPNRSPRGPKTSEAIGPWQPPDKGDRAAAGKDTAHDYDLALAALHTGDVDSADALLEKLKKADNDGASLFHLAVTQLSLAVQERRDCQKRGKASQVVHVFNSSRPRTRKNVVDVKA